MTRDPLDEPATGARTPLFEARHAPRYERQRLIREYQVGHECRLAVLMGPLLPDSITLFEELLFDADPGADLHLMIDTPGGDGESAIRLVRQAQSRCRRLTLIVPNQAKSAGTLLALGAHEILMGPTSDLGPIDPQFLLPDGSWASAKAIIQAVEHAEREVKEDPDTFPLHAALLVDLTALKVQQARDAIARTDSQIKQALTSCPNRDEQEADALAKRLKDVLVTEPASHGAVISAAEARNAGLPVPDIDLSGGQWRLIWRLWTKYFALEEDIIYEGAIASHVL